jgi:hypothetical protein
VDVSCGTEAEAVLDLPAIQILSKVLQIDLIGLAK